MKSLKSLLCIITLISFVQVSAQTKVYSVANAHSHNDYEQKNPFFEAYKAQFGSIEADIYLRNGKLLVAHDTPEITEKRSLEGMYLTPLANFIKTNGGYVYSDTSRKLQLLIDIKTDSIHTLNTLISLLKKYPSIIENRSVRIVITGNRPADSLYETYPDFIWFDGWAGKEYSKKTLSKIAMLSTYFGHYSKWKGIGVMPFNEEQELRALVTKANNANKPIRFWGCPDFTDAWIKMIQLKVDFINTDHISALSAFFKNDKSSTN